MLDDLTVAEARKYERVWATDFYRDQSDGEPIVDEAFRLLGCEPGETLIDWGCGTGIAAGMFKDRGLDVTGFDLAANCLNAGIDVPLVVGTLWDPPSDLRSRYAFCSDVLEHIPPDYVGAALDVISERTLKGGWIQVDTVPDLAGPKMDPPEVLHLTVQPGIWWFEELKKRWGSVLPRKGAYTRIGFLCGYPRGA